jgi:hypothetical protein
MNQSKNITIAISIILAIGLIIWAGYSVFNNQNDNTQSVTDFTSCAAAGNPVMESHPRQCRSADGKLYIEDIDDITDTTKTFVSEKGVEIKINDWSDNKQISSPITITGEVPGNWSFEASFPVVLVDWDGLIIAEKPATLTGDWMTTDYVPFSVTLEFDKPTVKNNGSIILQRDNPSGLPENDDAVEIPIIYS